MYWTKSSLLKNQINKVERFELMIETMFRLEMKKVSMRSTVIFVLPFLYRLNENDKWYDHCFQENYRLNLGGYKDTS